MMEASLIQRAAFIDESPIIGSIFNILVAYPSAIWSDPFMTAVALASLFLLYMDSEDDVSTVDSLWGTLLYIAKQLLPSDDRQSRLVSREAVSYNKLRAIKRSAPALWTILCVRYERCPPR